VLLFPVGRSCGADHVRVPDVSHHDPPPNSGCQRGIRWVRPETGAGQAFAPARSLYAAAGFVPFGLFGDYPESQNSAFMTRC
jgi:hypothetical protein